MNPARAIWDFWVKPIRAERLAAFRIVIASVVLFDVLFSLLPSAEVWFGPMGPSLPELSESYSSVWWRWSLLPVDADMTTVYVMLALLAVCALFTSVGFLTRIASIAMWALLSSFFLRNWMMLNAADVLLRSATFYVAIAPSGAAWSIDNLIRSRIGWKPTGWVRPWSLRLIQIQLCIVYFFTGIEKLAPLQKWLNGETHSDWLSGQAVARSLHHVHLARFEWPSHIPWQVLAPMTWLTIAWEILFVVLICFRRTRYATLAFGVLLHAGIMLLMEVTHFSVTITAFYFAFVPVAVLMDIRGKATGDIERRRYRVYFDGMCPVCLKSRRTLERLDWLGRLQFIDIHNRAQCEGDLPDVSYADMLRRMYVKRPDGKWFGGFAAFRAIAAVIPLWWVTLPFLWLPGVGLIGRWVYDVIARNRFKWAKCDDEFCSLHLKLLAGKELDDEVIAQVIDLHQKRTKAKA